MLLEQPISMHYDSIDDAFPNVDPEIIPFGSRIIVQVRRAKETSKGGIILSDDTRKAEAGNTQTCKVISLGPLAFKNRTTMTTWPEGEWCHAGDFVRTPKFGGDRFTVKHEKEEIEFVIFNDLDIIGKVTGDPTKVRAFI